MLSNNTTNCFQRYRVPCHRTYPRRGGSGSKLEILLLSERQLLVLDIKSHRAGTSVDIQKGEARLTGGSERCYTGDEAPSTPSIPLSLPFKQFWSMEGLEPMQVIEQGRSQGLELMQVVGQGSRPESRLWKPVNLCYHPASALVSWGRYFASRSLNIHL